MLLSVVGRALVSQAMLRHAPLMRLVRVAMRCTATVSATSVPSRLVALSSVLVDVVLLDTILVHGQSIALEALHLVPILVIVLVGARQVLLLAIILTTHHLIWCSVAPRLLLMCWCKRLHEGGQRSRHVRSNLMSSVAQEFLLGRDLREGIDVLIVMVRRRLILLRSIRLRLLRWLLLLLLHLVRHLLLNVRRLLLLVEWLLLLLHAVLRLLLWFGLLLLAASLLAFLRLLLLLLGLHLHGGGLRLRLLLASALLFALLLLLPLLGGL